MKPATRWPMLAIEPSYIEIMANRLQAEPLAGIVEAVGNSPLVIEASVAA
jgi:hypothetical protein